MLTKRVNRYYCEFCKKAGCSAFHIRKHAAACTMNPARVCGVCTKMLEQEQPILADLMALLPDPKEFIAESQEEFSGKVCQSFDADKLEAAIPAAMPALRDAVEGCPVCKLAALRQKGIPAVLARDLKVKDELVALWNGINRERDENSYATR